jgi:hypothetical protein
MNRNHRVIMSTTAAAGLVLALLTMSQILSPTTALAKVNTSQQQSDHVQKFNISGKIADAHWFIENEGEQTFTDVYISLVDAASKQDDLYTISTLDVFISQYKLIEECVTYPDGSEECYYDYQPVMEFFGYDELQDSDYKISNNVRSASVNGVELTGYDYFSGQEKTIIVDATWTAEGSLVKIKRAFSETDEGYKLTYKFMGTGRDAEASAQISGDIDLVLDEGTYQDADASILKAREGNMVKILGAPH